MASTLNFLLIAILLFTLILVLESRDVRAPFKPNSIILPLQKDPTTNLYITYINKRTPQLSIPFILDLNGRFLWVTCDQNYLSSTYNAPFCHSTQCSLSGIHYCHKCSTAPKPGCHNNTCGVIATNPVTGKNSIAEIAEDVVSFQSYQGSNTTKDLLSHSVSSDMHMTQSGTQNRTKDPDLSATGPYSTIPRFIFACANSSLVKGMPQNVQGVAGLGHTPVSLPIQLTSRLGFDPQFSLCLPPNSNQSTNGSVIFGKIPSFIQTTEMVHTPLTVGAQGEYYILIKSIRINNKTVPFNSSLLSTTRGFGGTMISTTTLYTVLEHSVFTTFTRFFAEQLVGVPQVKAIPPFGLCFNNSDTLKDNTPNVDFVMQNRNVSWTVLGDDALVKVQSNVSCLAVVDGGRNARASITIGASMLEDGFFHFDLSRSLMGFFPNRLSRPVDCSSFNFSGDGGLEFDMLRG